MKFTFLGTGTSQGIPVITCHCNVCLSLDVKDKRTRTSLLIESEASTVVIDSGPDFRQQMLREKVKDLDAVVFTHGHKDHVLD
jgi:phosphoribosyl 1,2-cyclic phosphate phosphodiesterase